jgi:hypothetical protein
MKPRHAAALVLVGWYLMMPPLSRDQPPGVDAPLSRWTQVGSLDTLEDCDLARKLYAQKALNRFDEADRQFNKVSNARKDALLRETATDLYLQYQKARVRAGCRVVPVRCLGRSAPQGGREMSVKVNSRIA